jgi:hypothetical protein
MTATSRHDTDRNPIEQTVGQHLAAIHDVFRAEYAALRDLTLRANAGDISISEPRHAGA